MRSAHTALLRSEAAQTPHQCGPNKNLSITKNQQYQGAAANVVAEPLEENDGLADAIAALQHVGVNVASCDLGIHAGRGRTLRHGELLEWALWVQSIKSNGIANKAAFAATKVRSGFTVRDMFPRFIEQLERENEQNEINAQKAVAEGLAEQAQRERSQRADSLIAALDISSRQNLREKALRDPAAWLGRDTSRDVFDRLVSSIERRLILDHLHSDS
jgi:hypothetical protein